MKDFEWLSGEGTADAGIGRTEVNDRKMKRRTINHPDGRVEVIETVRETGVRSTIGWGSSKDQLEQVLKPYTQLETYAAQHELPLNSLQSMKAEILRELQHQSAPYGGLKLLK